MTFGEPFSKAPADLSGIRYIGLVLAITSTLAIGKRIRHPPYVLLGLMSRTGASFIITKKVGSQP